MTTPFLACIGDAAKDAGLDPETAAEAREVYQDALEAAEGLGPAEADRVASVAAMTALERAALRQERLRALGVRSRRAALESAAAFKQARGYKGVKALGGGGAKPPKGGWVQGGEPPETGHYASGGMMADWLKELVDGSGGQAGASGVSIKGRYQALRGTLDARMADLAEAFDSALGTGHRGRATLDNVVREAFGEDTGDTAAKGLAKTWGETAEHARQLFNRAGGDIGKLEKWGLPQSHAPIAVRRAGREGWIEAILPRLERAKMIDDATGQPFGEKRLRAVLGEVYQSIVTRGAIDREPGEGLGKGRMADRHSEHRFLIFKSADDWLAYGRDFAVADPYAAMVHHLDRMALDIAQLQVLGPNPSHAFEWLAKAAMREAEIEQGLGAKANRGLKSAAGDVDSARKMYGLLRGDLGRADNPENLIARVGTATRAALAGVQLGSAPVRDLFSNPVFARQARIFAGLSKRGDFQALVAHAATPEARKMARRTGFILESTRARYASAVQDFMRAQTVGGKAAEGANTLAKMLPNFVHRASLLEPSTRAQRWSAQHEFMGALYDRMGRSLADMAASADPEDRALAATARARGFTEAEWKQIVSTPPEEPAPSARFISPQAVGAAHGDELGWRVAEMIEREVRMMVPEPSLWAQAQLRADTRPGTVKGELMLSATSYRSFTVTQTYGWSREFAFRGMQDGTDGRIPWQMRAAMMAAPMLTQLVILGGLYVWTNDMIKGNDPRPLWDEDPEKAQKAAVRFWAAAALQSGGMGLFSDYLTSMQARNGKTSAMSQWGPQMGFMSDSYNLTVGNVDQALAGEDTHLGEEAVRYAARYGPISSLWYARTAWDRMVMDQLERVVDEDAEAGFRRRQRRLKREFGQDQWWPEGQAMPERAPHVAGVLGGE